ncbi:MAG: preprotein translocase subunit SecA [Verrucomicrobiales bacterium]|nr:preprotein translocase subunit SecA [Verrucomicrobiales bacterium]
MLKLIWPTVGEINRIEEGLQSQDASVLKDKTAEWKAYLNRYNEDVEFFSDRKLKVLEKEQQIAILTGWVSRYQTLENEFASLKDLLPREGQISTLGEDELIAAILKAQENFTTLRASFPEARAEYLEKILPEAYAVVKNTARRLCGTTWDVCDHPVTWEMVHFDVQLIGGIALHRGTIAEMATGEGKTLVATLPVYLNALTGLGVHVITVNDYLARRDSEWMGHLFEYLGLSVGCIQNDQHGDSRREQYQNDITYGTSSEFGFDYLRDNGMATNKDGLVQRSHYYALIDEVDSVLIDEARTPLIISGPVTSQQGHQYDRFKPLVEQLTRRQTTLCNQLVSDAKTKIEASNQQEAGVDLFAVKLGQPRNRALIRLMEDPDIRRLIDKTELSFYQDAQKTALFQLKEELYFILDQKNHEADLTEKGRSFLNPDDPDAFVLPDLASAFADIDGNTTLSDEARESTKQELQEQMNTQAQRMHNISQLLRAYCIYERDVSYVVEDNQVMIVDENTGRKMPGRRWSDGLHQAVEAKEGVHIEDETQTYATITIQNYFRLYEKLSGMTGTAETEAAEFKDIYALDVLVIPTNRPILRADENDQIYKTRREKFSAVIKAVGEANATGQPILLGTASVESSETISRMLKRAKIPHSVLNAKYHMQEAEIVRRAGLKGAVTVATNMAGRGTDIKLGEGVKELGGLKVIGTERHQSRRIDRQLRGRCARQGDPGASMFFVSFEDELMVNFGASERMTKMMDRFGLEEGQELEHPLLNRSVENAQKKVEQRNYVSRKRVLEYDDVMNQQREVVYGYRNEVLETENPHGLVSEIIEKSVPSRLATYVEGESGELDYKAILHWVNNTFPLGLTPEQAEFDTRDEEGNIRFITDKVHQAYELKINHEDPDVLEELERYIILSAIDRLWQDHLYVMDGVREGIGMRQHAQKDPLVEYKTEAYAVFVELMDNIDHEVLGSLFRTTTRPEEYQAFLENLPQQLSHDTDPLADLDGGNASRPSQASAIEQPQEDPNQVKITLPIKRELPKVGRNEDCPCGSGKKFKNCCGRKA